MADQGESGCAKKPDSDIDELLMSPDPRVRSEGHRLTFIRYRQRVQAYLRATYWYCLDEAESASICGETFHCFIKKVENKKKPFYPSGNLYPLLIGIAENLVMQLLTRRWRRKECQCDYLENEHYYELRPETVLAIREILRVAIVEEGILPAFERLVFTAWHELVIKNAGFVPTHEELRDRLIGPPTTAVFGTLLADEDPEYLESLTESVKKALHRAFKKLRDYLDRRG